MLLQRLNAPWPNNVFPVAVAEVPKRVVTKAPGASVARTTESRRSVSQNNFVVWVCEGWA